MAFGVVALASLSLPATATHNMDEHSPNMAHLSSSPNGRDTTNSDMAFWGKYAYQGDYGGLRIFDLTNPAAPALVGNLVCSGAQNDVNVWDRDGNGTADIAFLSVDRTQSGPNCGSTDVAHDDPTGWEGLRIVDISNPATPTQIGSVYLDCGSHTNTLWPGPGPNEVLLYNSSYPLRPGPTCGQVRGPAAGRDPNHGVIQVVEVTWNPATPLGAVTAAEIAEPKINYPGDPDNKFTPAEHGLPGPPVLEPSMRACHDISVFVPLRLAAAACAEQAQLWRVLPSGLPDTENPLWVYDDTTDETGPTGDINDPGIVVDFWHSATFSWDGEIVHFEDESFDAGECPPVTEVDPTVPNRQPGDTGRMFFFDTATGAKLSQFMSPMPWETDYCSAHLGNVVPATDKYLLTFAWYMGGITVLDFTNPASPSRVAYYDGAGPTGPAGDDSFDNWAAYWYEGPALPGNSLTIYATDGVHDPSDNDGGARGFLSLRADVAANEIPLDHLNPQTQDLVAGPGGVVMCKGKIATLVGTNGNDVLVGTPGEDVVVGLGGNDKIKALAGDDTVCAGSGNDEVRGASGKDLLLGEGGKDKLLGKGGKDTLRGGAAKDLVKGGGGRDKLAGQAGNDKLRGQGGPDKLNGGSGRDHCNGGGGTDTATKCEVEKLIP
jgi:hypothetical protein